MTRRANENTKALDAFAAVKIQMGATGTQFAALSVDHLESILSKIYWDQVDSLNPVGVQLFGSVENLLIFQSHVGALNSNSTLAINSGICAIATCNASFADAPIGSFPIVVEA